MGTHTHPLQIQLLTAFYHLCLFCTQSNQSHAQLVMTCFVDERNAALSLFLKPQIVLVVRGAFIIPWAVADELDDACLRGKHTRTPGHTMLSVHYYSRTQDLPHGRQTVHSFHRVFCSPASSATSWLSGAPCDKQPNRWQFRHFQLWLCRGHEEKKKSSQHVRIIPVIKQSSIACLHEAGVSTKQTPAPYCWYAERQINVCLPWVIQVECKLFRVGCCWYSVCVRVWAHEYTHVVYDWLYMCVYTLSL